MDKVFRTASGNHSMGATLGFHLPTRLDIVFVGKSLNRDHSMQLPHCLAVLGMHRSGTSCLTGLLEDAGIYLGEVSKWNPHNTKGNQEHNEIVELNNDVLAYNQGAWDRPPARACIWTEEMRARRDAIIARFRGHEPWAFKDPRTLLTLEGWREALPELVCVGTFRHPWSVARSLVTRGGIEFEQSLALWETYNQKLLALVESEGIPLVCYDLPAAAYLEAVRALLKRLGIDRLRAFAFFDEALRHQQELSEAELPASSLRLYQRLCLHIGD